MYILSCHWPFNLKSVHCTSKIYSIILELEKYLRNIICIISSVVFFALNSNAHVNSSIKFIENKGQWQSNILFKTDIPGGTLFVEKNCLTYNFIDQQALKDIHDLKNVVSIKQHAVKVFFENSNNHVLAFGTKKLSEYQNYFVGNNKSKWASNVPLFEQITIQNIYDGIDLELIALNGSIKANFIVHRGANFKQIKLRYEGTDNIKLLNEELVVTTSLAEIKDEKPESFQRESKSTKRLFTRFILDGNIVSYDVPDYNPEYELIIDPNIIFGTFTGSISDNWGFSATYDNNGNAYGSGTVYGSSFPVTTGAYQTIYKGGNNSNSSVGDLARDIVITKFNSLGTQLLYATFLGGTDNEQAYSMTVNSLGELLILGTTNSYNFPTTSGAFDQTYNGDWDVFVAKLSSNGSALNSSTYLGGYESDGVNGSFNNYANNDSKLPYNYADYFRGELIVDQFNNIYIASVTRSKVSDAFPIRNAFQSTFGGGLQDGFIAKFNSSLSQLNFCTYAGGNKDDACYSLCFDKLNNLFVCGGTQSTNLSVTNGGTFNGDIDGFLLKTNSSGTSLIGLIYVGTAYYDQTYFVQADNNADIYVLGQTTGAMTPSGGVYYNSGGKQFIKIFNNSLSVNKTTTIFGTGGSYPDISPTAFQIDACNRVYLSGWGGYVNNPIHNTSTGNTYGLPITNDAFQKTTDGSDFYLMLFDKNLATLKYATFYGGSQSNEHVDGGTSHFDINFTIYQAVCAGCGGRSDFPTTSGAYSQYNRSGNCNLGLIRFDLNPSPNPPQFRDTIITVSPFDTINFTVKMIDKDSDLVSFTASGSILNPGANPAIISNTIKTKGLTTSKFYWVPNCNDVSADTFLVDLTLTDDACPVIKTSYGKIKIVVNSPLVVAPYPQCLIGVNDNCVKIKWNAAATVPRNFNYYAIYRSVNNSSFVLWKKINNPIDSSIYDSAAFNNKNVNYVYCFLGVNTCDISGDTSRLVSSIFQGDTISDHGFSNMQDTLFVMNVTDTLRYNFVIDDTDGRDSLQTFVSGNLIDQKKVLFQKLDGFRRALISIYWASNCSDKIGDTNYLYVKVKDNQCPVSRTKTKVIKVVLNHPPADPIPELSCAKKIDNNSIEISIPKFTASRYLKKIKLIRFDKLGVAKDLIEFNTISIQNIYQDASAINNNINEYCYQVIGFDVCDFPGDSSIKICNTQNIAPSNLDWHTVTVVNDKEVKLVWYKSKLDSTQFWKYGIYKKQDRINPEFTFLSIVSNKSDSFFIDNSVNVDEHSYCYKVSNIDNCGAESTSNDEACSILLQGKSKAVQHDLYWMDYVFWKAGTKKYELLRSDAYNPDWIKVNGLQFKSLEMTDDKLNLDVGLYYYKVVAFENPWGNLATSESNTIELIQEPRVFAPNAYTPNSDGLNDGWISTHSFVKDFNLKIFNRWGQKIFETNNKYESFKSVINNQQITSDVFVYLITYTGWDSSVRTLKGNFTLLR